MTVMEPAAEHVRIAIILPTYNGEQYLPEQLDSLLAQSHHDFVIVTRDDGSSDASRALIAGYAEENPGRFHIVESGGVNLGASAGFSLLMQYVLENKAALALESAYIMCCDQDDIWHPHKITISLQRMRILESQSPGLPLLVHSDLRVVDEHRSQVAPSFVGYQGLNPYRNSFTRLLVSNVVTGCTALFNEELALLASPVPPDAIMHDWWLALLASAFGRVSFIEKALVDYRQHGRNTLGAREYLRSGGTLAALSRLQDPRHDEVGRKLARQAAACNATLGKMLKPRQRLLARLVAGMNTGGAVKRNLVIKIFHVLAA